jgi:hypothetical protein
MNASSWSRRIPPRSECADVEGDRDLGASPPGSRFELAVDDEVFDVDVDVVAQW